MPTAYASASTLARRVPVGDALALLASIPTDNLEAEATEGDWLDAVALASGADAEGATDHALEMAAHLADALRLAGSRLESLLARRYAAPVVTSAQEVPAEVEGAVVSVARYHLYTRLGMNPPEGVERDYEEAMAWLMRVADGKADIPSISHAPEAVRRARVLSGEREYAPSVQFYEGLF